MRTYRIPAVIAPIFAVLLGSTSLAQVTPDRTYNGINRPFPAKVTRPAGTSGEMTIDLYHPPETEPIASQPVLEGGVDLAALFPVLWSSKAPRLLEAQLVVGGKKAGPALVLRPMINPALPMLWNEAEGKAYYVDPRTKKPSVNPAQSTVIFTPDTPVYSGIEAWVDKHAVFETTLGEIEFRLRPDEAPNTVRNFMRLAEGGFYTDIIFHRVVAKLKSGAPFVVQVGDPTGTGSGGPGYAIDLENSHLNHDFGVLSMARDSDPNTNGSQVFICLSREGTARLDGKYTAFAEAVSGAQTILDLASVPVKDERPLSPPVLLRVRLIDAPPYGEGPARVTRPEDGSGTPIPPKTGR